ncbi:IS66-like element accessory protein TnpA, partial [Paracraurococcus lichenis]
MTRGEARRRYSPEEKVRLLAEVAAPGARVSEVSRRHGICASLLHRWRRQGEGRPVQKQARRAAPLGSFVPLLLEAGHPAHAAGSGPPMRDVTELAMEVVLRNGRVLRIGADADAAAVAR